MAKVQRDDYRWNFINTEGALLFPRRWFKFVDDFNYGVAPIEYDDGMWDAIDTNGNILSQGQKFTQITLMPNAEAYFFHTSNQTYYFDNQQKMHKLII